MIMGKGIGKSPDRSDLFHSIIDHVRPNLARYFRNLSASLHFDFLFSLETKKQCTADY